MVRGSKKEISQNNMEIGDTIQNTLWALGAADVTSVTILFKK